MLEMIQSDKEDYNRIGLLLSRRERIHSELDRLSRLGIYYLSRIDEDYPSQYRKRLKESTPSYYSMQVKKCCWVSRGLLW